MNLFTLKNVKKSYGRGEAAVHALNGLNLEIGEGAFAAITGRSGSGKSTLMKVLAGLVTPESGEGYFRDEKLNGRSWKQLLEYRRKHVGIITQSYSLLDEDTVFDNIALPLQLRHVGREEIEREVTELCRTLGILEKLDACANELSRRSAAARGDRPGADYEADRDPRRRADRRARPRKRGEHHGDSAGDSRKRHGADHRDARSGNCGCMRYEN